MRFARTDASFRLSAWLFLRVLAVVYLVAFLSALVQLRGLVGSDGILPVSELLARAREALGASAPRQLPTLFWLGASDSALFFLPAVGAILSLAAFFGFLELPVFFLLWALYLSIVSVGREFFGYQWDYLLLEAGFSALGLACVSHRAFREGCSPPSIARFTLLFLACRLNFSSGAVKLLSGDETWRQLTALEFHFETQPLPGPLSYYVDHLPAALLRCSTAGTLAIEIVAPVLLFGPRRVRHVGATLLIALQGLIAITGSYTFFNLLTLGLLLLAFDDQALRRFARVGPGTWRERARASVITANIFGAILFLLSAVQLGRTVDLDPLPRALVPALRVAQSFGLSSTYGLFAVMTTVRREIVLEVSDDAQHWTELDFPAKPGRLDRRPVYVAPFQPRVDWQMWFAALGSIRNNRWLVAFMSRLLEGSRPALALLETSEISADRPPRYIRAIMYEYHFTSAADGAATGNWWSRTRLGVYCPALSRQKGAGTPEHQS